MMTIVTPNLLSARFVLIIRSWLWNQTFQGQVIIVRQMDSGLS